MLKKRKIIPYNPDLKDLAKELRRNMTFSEVLLWNELKNKKIAGFDFDRQRPIGNYIVDFYCKELSLAIEIDGDTHIFKYDADEERQRELEDLGVRFLRFEDVEVKKSMANVLRVIEDWIEKNKPSSILSRDREKPTPGPSREGNLKKNLYNYSVKPTPSPSREGNTNKIHFNSSEEPTPNPSKEGNAWEAREGNANKIHFNSSEEPTPNPSKEGNAWEAREGYPDKIHFNSSEEPTPNPSKEGNAWESREGNANKIHFSNSEGPTPGPSKEGNAWESREGNAWESETVLIGSVPLGGKWPVRIQSMTNTDTMDTRASVEQCIRIIEAGADFVRLTAQGVREAENLAVIKKELRKAGFEQPLIADIHFNPAAAETAARIVEKVRINPGNYADKRASFIKEELTDREYEDEIERIHHRLLPLINICRENETAVRIGINHGSLSDRIMNRYGNTAKGMVVSAVEFIRIFRSENYHKLVLSLKSSDTAVMLEANRMLAEIMKREGYSYPIHLGVTEAGEGEDGRVRSSAGIGALLYEGIGDTIRVSLTEDPEKEIPVVKEIVRFVCGPSGRIAKPEVPLPFRPYGPNYKPEVLTFNNGCFLDENGKPYKGKILSFTPGNPPDLIHEEEEKAVVNPVFDEDDAEKLAIDAAALTGRYFILRQAGGICIRNDGKVRGDKLRDLSFSILQATEARITRNRYISCPTCGRTKFNLQDALKEVKEATAHLTGLRIAVMGCIVNGPGEMAGADYGYVGAGSGKVHIYRGTEAVVKNVAQEEAVGVLLKVIEGDRRLTDKL